MSSNDSRLYIRNSRAFFEGGTFPQAFYGIRPLVKTPATEDADAVFYVAEDVLTPLQAMRLYAPHRVAIFKEVEGETPEQLGTLDQFPDALPDDYTHVLYGLAGPSLRQKEIFALKDQADAMGAADLSILIPADAIPAYKASGQLPE